MADSRALQDAFSLGMSVGFLISLAALCNVLADTPVLAVGCPLTAAAVLIQAGSGSETRCLAASLAVHQLPAQVGLQLAMLGT